jgi:hypothetical protein
VGIGASAEAGIIAAGVSVQGGGFAGAFSNKGTVSGGAAASGAVTAYAGSSVAGAPAQSSTIVTAAGAYAGAGFNVFATNAASVHQLGGPFTTVTINVGIGPGNLGVQFSTGGGIWQVSITPPIISVGWGASFSVVTTNTVTTKSGCK